MVLQLVTEFGYNLVEQSWLMSTIFIKYFLLIIGARIIYEQDFDPEHISDRLVEYSDEIVSLMVLLGLVNVFIGFQLQPLMNPFSQVVAFLYFLFLFWEY